MKISTILLDLDDTILDFKASERASIIKLMEYLNVKVTEDRINKYHEIDNLYWQRYEKKEITKDVIFKERFKVFFEDYCLCKFDDYENINDIYFSYLTTNVYLIPSSIEFLEKIKEHFKVYVITNGVKFVQEKRIELSSLKKYFDKIYISEEIGLQKPDKNFFLYVLNDTKSNKENTIVIGDSLTSDITGANNTGLKSIWFNPTEKNCFGISPTYTVKNYQEILNILL